MLKSLSHKAEVTLLKEEIKRNLFIDLYSNRLIRKQMNIDEFGRYKGGLPQKGPVDIGARRKGAANEPGTFATRADI